jgi:hypothetical protein
MDAQYKLTYDDSAAPSHYGWKQSSRLDLIEKALKGPAAPEPSPSESDVRKILAALDDQGRWVTTYDGEGLVGQPKFARGFAFLSSAVFSRNVELLSDFLSAKPK